VVHPKISQYATSFSASLGSSKSDPVALASEIDGGVKMELDEALPGAVLEEPV
jgi:hypothetical protein